MDEGKSVPSTRLMSDTAQTEGTRDDGSQAGNEPHDILSRSSMKQNNDTVPKKGSEDNETGGDEVKEMLRDGTVAETDQDYQEGSNVDSSDQRDEKGVKVSLPELDVLPVDEGAIEKLTVGFLQTFLPQAECSNAVLDELMRNQRVLIETLEQENAKFKENKMMSDLSELMTEAKKYHSKLVHLRKEMMSLHEKSTKLKKRALKLQHHKMKQNLQKEQQREREMEQEKHLIAKPAAKKTP
ncbi:biogenesis of lysosome-related organelles complex 1 subunit 6-like [Patiria miniata]|uniref:BLOC-1 subunit 6 n=1 Tax=Patiria miniata TaxID=46514 RepID=A0A914A3H8_PATMI|nr:biogenesis of lysosome-related organelles complex 1 subunit 6-like [Patiria miniata]XP_038058388.1 biogenesis of lysosome-related organelles complex 1 subunit 6-like [Patiria miniata]XP_038058389.1 biogenesis of lysosome-related organelles complex 1 subunit 6-like [Patiria miniata]XP_038058390.1 biogenesis of lysosome-related organelles complex 1 subunit 6-like [Patiria miniata]